MEAHAVGPDESHAAFASGLHKLSLQGHSLLAAFLRKAAGEKRGAANSLFTAILDYVYSYGSRNAQYGMIHRTGHFQETAVGLVAPDVLARMNRI